MLIRLVIYFSILLYIPEIKPVIATAEVLSSPEQTVVLMGDMHTEGTGQLPAIVKAAQRTGAHCIVESDINEIQGKPLATSLLRACHKRFIENNIPHSAVEFRQPYASLLGSVEKIEGNCRSLEQTRKFIEEKHGRNIYNGFFQSLTETNYEVMEAIKKHRKELIRDEKEEHAVAFYTVAVNHVCSLAGKVVSLLPKPEKDNSIDMQKFLDVFIPGMFLTDKEGKFIYEDGRPKYAPNSLLSYTVEMSNALMDAVLVKEIVTHSDKKTLFVLAGAAHLENVRNVLLARGSVSKKTSNTNDSEVNMTEFLSDVS